MKFALTIDPRVCAELGVSVQEMERMTLREFFDLAYRRGYHARVDGMDKSDDPGLVVRMADDADPIVGPSAISR